MSDSNSFPTSGSSAPANAATVPGCHGASGGSLLCQKSKHQRTRPVPGPIRALVIAIVMVALASASPSQAAPQPPQIVPAKPAKEKITAITHPKFVGANDALFVAPIDRVIGVVVGGVAKAYPLRILMWHQVVNDVIGGKPVAVTYCPWTANAAVYDRVLGGKTLVLSPSGKLYEDNTLFYDNKTHSLWSQINGKAITGPDKGQQLKELASISTAWEVWKAYHPKSLVLSTDTGFARNYQTSPYTRDNSPYSGGLAISHEDDRLSPKEMVIAVDVDHHSEAFAFSRLAGAKLPLTTKLGDRKITIFFDPKTATAGATDEKAHIPAYTGFWLGWEKLHPESEIWGKAPPKPPPPLPIVFKDAGVLTDAREGQTATLLKNGKVLIAGGDKGHSPMLASAELYDPVKHASTPTGSMTHARGGHRATLLADGKVLMTGGIDDKAGTDTADLYDPATGRFTAPPAMNGKREKHTATLLKNGKVLIAGGYAGEKPPMASAELYDPVKNRFVPTGNMNAGRQGDAATLLPDGRVLVTGGMGGEGKWLKSAEIYDPATGRFTPTGNMGAGRLAHTATLLKNGQVLIAGGATDEGRPLASTELYDPATGSFSPGPDMEVARQGQSAVLLSNGDVLLVGGAGVDPKNRYLASVELYDPTTRKFSLLGEMLLPRFGPTLTLLDDGQVLVTGRFAAPSYFATATAELYRPPLKAAQ
jgi:Protein of unknown function (DUF3179)/Galactose oxidase, central domain/Kelch motif